MNKRFVVGITLASSGSGSHALAILETERRVVWPDKDRSCSSKLRYLERSDAGTAYRDVIERLKKMLSHKDMRPAGFAPTSVVLDVTQVGRPMLETFRAEGLDPAAVYLTEGGQVTRSQGARPDPQEISLPWRDMMTTMQSVYQLGRLQNAVGLPLLDEYTSALLSYDAAAWKDTLNLELLKAVGIAAWVAEHGHSYGVGVPKAAARPVIKLYGGA